MNAIVTAGGAAQPGQPLYEATQGGLKAMLDIGGKPMVQWVLDALSETDKIERVFVVGLSPETDLGCAHPLVLLPDTGDVINNIRSGARAIREVDPGAEQAILVSGDLPALRAEIVDWLLDTVQEAERETPAQDIYYTIIERKTMESQFPGSRRTYVKLKSLEVCGGDLHCFRLQAAIDEIPLWNRLVEARKSPLRQASLLGYDTLLFLMLRQLGLQDAVKAVCKRLGITAQAVLSPYAEIGMDVDKPFQLEIIREHLADRYETHPAGTV